MSRMSSRVVAALGGAAADHSKEKTTSENEVGAKAGQLRQVTLHRLDALPERPRREEVIHGIGAVGELVALVAPAGMGKSTVAQLMVTCIAEGRPFLGRGVKSGPAIYIAAERWNEATRRLLAIRYKSKAPLYVASTRPNLANPGDVESLAKSILQVSANEHALPALIVIDTLARCMPGLDENSARDMGMVVEGLTRLSEQVPSAMIVFVHHAGKGGSGEMRGSTALIGAVDLELRVESKGSSKRLVVTKANAVPEDQALKFRLEPIEYRDGPDADPGTVITAVEDFDEVEQVLTDLGPSRDERLLSLIETLAVDRVVERRLCLAEARGQGLIEGKTLNSTAEQFRKALVRLRDAELISFDEKKIALGSGPNPNEPNGPP